MSAPIGWDERSWLDVLHAERAIRAELEQLRELIGKDEPCADRIASVFESIESRAAVGGVAASWCKA